MNNTKKPLIAIGEAILFYKKQYPNLKSKATETMNQVQEILDHAFAENVNNEETSKRAIQLLKEAENELSHLKRRNAILEAKVSVLDTVNTIINMARPNGYAMCNEPIESQIQNFLAQNS